MDKTPSENQSYAFFKEINHHLKLLTVTKYLGTTSYYLLFIYAVFFAIMSFGSASTFFTLISI